MRRLLHKDNKAESWEVAMLLALVGGYLDIYCYLARGKVFANTQTGNLVLLGCNIAQGNKEKVIYYLIAICAFLAGVCMAKYIEYKCKETPIFIWTHITLGIEIIGIFIVMFIPAGTYSFIANMIISFLCGLQVQGFRKVNGNNYSSVMFTGNLRSLADKFSSYLIDKERKVLESVVIYLGIVIAFVIGGWWGALTTNAYGIKAVGLIDIILSIVLIILYREHKQNERNDIE